MADVRGTQLLGHVFDVEKKSSLSTPTREGNARVVYCDANVRIIIIVIIIISSRVIRWYALRELALKAGEIIAEATEKLIRIL